MLTDDIMPQEGTFMERMFAPPAPAGLPAATPPLRPGKPKVHESRRKLPFSDGRAHSVVGGRPAVRREGAGRPRNDEAPGWTPEQGAYPGGPSALPDDRGGGAGP